MNVPATPWLLQRTSCLLSCHSRVEWQGFHAIPGLISLAFLIYALSSCSRLILLLHRHGEDWGANTQHCQRLRRNRHDPVPDGEVSALHTWSSFGGCRGLSTALQLDKPGDNRFASQSYSEPKGMSCWNVLLDGIAAPEHQDSSWNAGDFSWCSQSVPDPIADFGGLTELWTRSTVRFITKLTVVWFL